MKITDIEVDGFGVWSELTVNDLPADLAVFFGPNEAGKTTLMQFIRTMFYGFTADRRTRYLPPLNGTGAGGSLNITSRRGKHTIQRQPSTPDSMDRIRVEGPNGSRRGPQPLVGLLAGIDESIFSNVFSFGLRDLQELGTLNDTDAAEHLYALASGMDRISLVQVMRELTTKQQQLLDEGDASLIATLLSQREGLQEKVDQQSQNNRRWTDLHTQLSEIETSIIAQQATNRHLAEEARTLEVAAQVYDLWSARSDVIEQIKVLGHVPALADNTMARLESVAQQLAQLRGEVQTVKRQAAEIKQQATILPINRVLCSNACRIDALAEHEPWISSLEKQIARLKSHSRELSMETTCPSRDIASTIQLGGFVIDNISRPALTELKKPGERLQQTTHELEQLRAEVSQVRQESDEAAQKIESQLGPVTGAKLTDSVHAHSDIVAQMKQRIHLESRIEKLTRHQTELQEDRREMMDEQFLPWSRVQLLGIPFVIGLTLLLGGVFWSSVLPFAWFIIVLGGAGLAITIFVKLTMERRAEDELDDCERQLEQLAKQLTKACGERDQIDHQLPRRAGQLDGRLKDAEAELAKLEDLMPLETERQQANDRLQASESRLTQAETFCQEARCQWDAALQRYRLPAQLTPAQVSQFTLDFDNISNKDSERKSTRDEMEERQAELQNLKDRITRLFLEIEMEPFSEDVRTQLRQLQDAHTEQQKLLKRRREMKLQYRNLSRKCCQLNEHGRELIAQRQAIFSQLGVSNTTELHQVIEKNQELDLLHQQHGDLSQQITAALGDSVAEETVVQIFESDSVTSVEQERDEACGNLEKAHSELNALNQQFGELKQEIKSLADDDRFARAQFELGCIDQELRQAIHRWRVTSVVILLLDRIRKVYETERQPETLNAASQFLAEMTDRRYTRIWTPFDEDALRVDDANGESLPLDVLSCGTRETIFIAIRLALVEMYADRGVELPLVLDDVLVNLDTQRATATARVLHQFAARGHQVLLFTCHEHICRMFQTAGVEVRLLSGMYDSIEPMMPTTNQAHLEPPRVEIENTLETETLTINTGIKESSVEVDEEDEVDEVDEEEFLTAEEEEEEYLEEELEDEEEEEEIDEEELLSAEEEEDLEEELEDEEEEEKEEEEAQEILAEEENNSNEIVDSKIDPASQAESLLPETKERWWDADQGDAA